MGGGLMQLVAYGAQDIYLTGNPQITFFKVVYRRHTNFSMETIEQTLNGTLDFGSQVSSTISRNGDLVTNMYIKYAPFDLLHLDHSSWTTGTRVLYPRLSYGLLKEIQIEIGGQEIDRHYAHWYSVREDLYEKNEIGTASDYNQYSNSDPLATRIDPADGIFSQTKFQRLRDERLMKNARSLRDSTTVYIPLNFWFCRNPGLALPLIALQYHEVKINITLSNSDVLGSHGVLVGNTVNPSLVSNSDFKNFKLLADYIYLDTDERRRFAQVSHEYLIEQLQFEEFANEKTLELNLNHPVKELIWYGVPVHDPHRTQTSVYNDIYKSKYLHQNGDELFSKLTTQMKLSGGIGGLHSWNESVYPSVAGVVPPTGSNFTSSSKDFNITLKLNGHERFSPQGITYFSRKQIYDHHTGPGSIFDQDAICVYSFALKPEDHQPSGTCNFSRIDHAELVFNKKPSVELETRLDEGGNYGPPGDAQHAKQELIKVDVPLQTIRVYAINYNVLRIMSGMGGLAYSN